MMEEHPQRKPSCSVSGVQKEIHSCATWVSMTPPSINQSATTLLAVELRRSREPFLSRAREEVPGVQLFKHGLGYTTFKGESHLGINTVAVVKQSET